jgi:hypothetical protein
VISNVSSVLSSWGTLSKGHLLHPVSIATTFRRIVVKKPPAFSIARAAENRWRSAGFADVVMI